jgi:methionyl-tRNA formyltransferase
MGTPEFAVASLAALLESTKHQVIGVVTAPDKPSGRGRNLKTSPVKDYAIRHGLQVLQPSNLKDPRFLEQLAAWRPDIIAVVAFRMLPEAVWSMPSRGTINLHASLLPRYRGAAPINWAIINGDTETGLTTFFINEAIDEGKVLLQEQVSIDENEDAGSLHDRMKDIGAQLLVKTITGIQEGKLQAVAQGDIGQSISHAPKLNADNRRIDWNRTAKEIRNLIRGLSPIPSAYSLLKKPEDEEGIMVKFFATEILDSSTLAPGEWRVEGNSALYIGTGKGDLSILEIQVSGKRRLKVKDLLNGWIPENGARFT